jgi:hypothetical protein
MLMSARLAPPLSALFGFLISIAASTAVAADLSARIAFDPSDLHIEETSEGLRASLIGLPVARAEAEPELPVSVRTFYIPRGFEVDVVRVTPFDEVRVARDVRMPHLRSAEILGPDRLTRAYPARAIEAGSSLHPARSGVSLGSGTMAGHRIHSVALFPVQWNERTGDLTLTTRFDVELDLRPAAGSGDLVRERVNENADRAFAEALVALVDNPRDVARSFTGGPLEGNPSGSPRSPEDLPSVEGSAVDFVIITSADLAPGFQTLADWKTKKGTPTVIRTVEWIDATYPAGHDRPERIRDFLRDAYRKWGIYLVLLGGEYHVVPPREVYNRLYYGGHSGRYIPTDQYFACLEGDWNADGDHLYGEGEFETITGDSVDLYPDLFVGRAPVETLTEVGTFVSKSMTYDKTPPAGYVEDVCYLGEVLFPEEWEYGDPPVEITLDGKDLALQFDEFIPVGWSRTERYQSDNNLDRNIALTELTAGHHVLALFSHGDAFKFSAGNGLNSLVYIADTDTLTNGDRLTFLMGTACNPNQLDLECQGESFMNNPNGGAVAVIGPTRVDFPLSASDFHETMLDYIFNRGITGFGAGMQLHRLIYVPLAYTDATPDRWTILSSMLFGDPELKLWTQEPESLQVSHSSVVPLGAPSITVTVTDAVFAPIKEALVCISDGNGTYSRGRTDAAGQATLPLKSISTGTVDVVCTARDFLPSETTFTLLTTAGPLLTLSGYTLDDDGTGASSGNGDGVLDAGETVELNLAAYNGGGATAAGTAVAATIEAGSSATFDILWNGVRDSSRVYIGREGENPTTIPFTLDFSGPIRDFTGAHGQTFVPDTTTGDKGVFVWQDREGWHMRWGGGRDTVTVAGVITTDGRFRGSHTLELESGVDAVDITAGEDSLTFTGTTHLNDVVDGFGFAMSDSTVLSLSVSADSIGFVAPGGTGNALVVFDVATSAQDERIAYIDLEYTSTSGGPWTAEVPVVFAAPVLEAYVSLLDDSNNPPVSGDGDGIAEVGETVRITPTVFNWGSGEANSVTGSASATTGITFVDSADSYGDITSLMETSGTDGYVLTLNDSTAVEFDLMLTDAVGRTWAKTIDFVPPAAPDSVGFMSTPDMIALTWLPNVEPDMAGYIVYRSDSSGTGFERQSFELLRTGTRFVDDGLAIGSQFYYRVAAVDSSGNEGPASAERLAWTTMPQVEGWPQYANSNVFSSILMVDADGNGTGEVYVGSQDWSFYGWDYDADQLTGFPIPTGDQIWGTAAAADVDKDGDQEIFFGSMDARFYAVHHDGQPVYNDDIVFLDLSVIGMDYMFRGAPTLVDVDKDNELEILVGNDMGGLYAFNHDGTPLAGADSTGLLYTAPGGAAARIWGSIAVADLANDTTREIVFTSFNNNLYVIDPDGNDMPGFPRTAGDLFQSGASLGDLDNDGTLEIVVGNNDDNLYAYNHEGGDYGAGGNGVLAALPGDIRSIPALCNLDGDPQLEIVVSCLDGHLYAFNHDGTGFLNAGGLFVTIDASAGMSASPIVVDVDGDSDFEILVGHRNGNFYGFHHDASPVLGLPIPTNLRIFSTAAAGDLDNDGDVDVAFASYDQTVNVIDFTGASTPAAYEWATYAGSNYRPSVYGERIPYQVGIDPASGEVFAFSLAQNAPNPFASGTTIRFTLPGDERVKLRIFDVTGRLVRTLVNGPANAGVNRVVWDGRDRDGHRLSSGVYFYRLESGTEMATRKVLLLR